MIDTSATLFSWKGRTGPFSIELDSKAFVPTLTTQAIAEALEIAPGDTVIDAGCGVGVLSFVAAHLGAKQVSGVDLSIEAVQAASRNAHRLGLSDRLEFHAGNLLEPMRGQPPADVIIGDVSGIPDPIAAISGWFPTGKAGGPTGSEVPLAMLHSIVQIGCLKPGGRLYLPIGTIQAQDRVLEGARKIFGADNMTPLIERELPLPDRIAKAQATVQLMNEGLIHLYSRGSRLLWRLQVWRCEMPPPPCPPERASAGDAVRDRPLHEPALSIR